MNNALAESFHPDRAPVDCLIAFGSNEGNSRAIYRDVQNRLAKVACDVVVASQPVVTVAVGGPPQNDFVNGAFRFLTKLSPADLHQKLINLETEFGRKQNQRWSARPVDLDLLLYGEQVFADAKLKIPHPRMSFRRFVLEPAGEIAAEMKHAVSGLTMGELLARINRPNNELWWLASQFNLAANLLDELKPSCPDWEFRLIERQDFAQSDFGAKPPKLIVHDFERPGTRWNAASLDVSDCSPEETKIEILAALKATEPASRT